MFFEIKEKDLLARIGKLQTKSGTIETPLLLPVINPSIQVVPPKKIHEVLGFEALITNAYILKKRFQDEPTKRGLHDFLDFKGVIMTDSGAYQILTHGTVQTTPTEIVEYQERIETDIATILDWPTGWKASRGHAERTVKKTIDRGRELFKSMTRKDILWVGPVQGGHRLDLIATCATEMRKLPFHIHALGSPTEVMQNYRFDMLVDMIFAAKTSLPHERPLHLFGAGHPFMFSLAVALGCDLFDSAAYALYAREDRYMTASGTRRLATLDYFPCPCPKCSQTSPKTVKEISSKDRQIFLAEHNLYVCQAELKQIKQATKEGRLWEHLQKQAHSHPALLQATRRLRRYEEYVEKHSPTAKRSGIFFFDSNGLARPEIVRHRKKIGERYSPPREAEILLLAPQTRTRLLGRSRKSKFSETIGDLMKAYEQRVHLCTYAAPFGVVPIELEEIYPLSQCEAALPLEHETTRYVSRQLVAYISTTNYKTVVLLNDEENWERTILNACKSTCNRKGIAFKHINLKDRPSRRISSRLEQILKR